MYLFWGERLGYTIADYQLDSRAICRVLETAINCNRWDTLEKMLESQGLWGALSDAHKMQAQGLLGENIASNIEFGFFLTESHCLRAPFSGSAILKAIVGLVQNSRYMEAAGSIDLFRNLVEMYAKAVARKFRPEHQGLLITVRRSIYECEMNPLEDLEEGWYETFPCLFGHIVRHWDFLFYPHFQFFDKMLLPINCRKIKTFVFGLFGLEHVLTKMEGAEEFFKKYCSTLTKLQARSLDPVLSALEYYMSITSALDHFTARYQESRPVVCGLVATIYHIYATCNSPAKDSAGAILEHLGRHNLSRLFAVVLEQSLSTGVAVLMVGESKAAFTYTVPRYSPTCMVYCIHLLKFTPEDFVELQQLCDTNLDRLKEAAANAGSDETERAACEREYRDRLSYLLHVLKATRQSFDGCELEAHEIGNVLLWPVPDALINPPCGSVVEVIWCFRYLLLRHYGVSLQFSKINMDINGDESISATEFAFFLNLSIERHSALISKAQVVPVKTPSIAHLLHEDGDEGEAEGGDEAGSKNNDNV